LFDLAAVAIVKNEKWAESYELPAPVYVNGEWVERPNNPRKVTIWEWFDVYGIVNDYFMTMENYNLVKTN
jgi:purine nucleosidase